MTRVALAPTNQHYDLDPSLFAGFLGSTMKYSAGRFESTDDTLDDIQRQKLRWVAGLLRLRPGARVLDVGCGWGALAIQFAEELSCEVVGVTPASEQAAFVVERARRASVDHLVSVCNADIVDVDLKPGSFDAVTFLGSIVHMPERLAILRKAFQATARGGRLYLSESCYRNADVHRRLSDSPGASFVREHVFGNGDMLPASLLIDTIERAGYALKGLHDLTDDYRRTIDLWLANLDAMADDAQFADRTDDVRKLRRYLEIGNAAWGIAAKHYALVAERSR